MTVDSDDFLDIAEGIDGLRVMKAMSRARIVRKRQEANPLRTVAEYRDNWSERQDNRYIGACGKPWSWRDVQKHIGMDKHRSMMRM